MNFINQKKTKEKENTKLLERILKEYSGDCLNFCISVKFLKSI